MTCGATWAWTRRPPPASASAAAPGATAPACPAPGFHVGIECTPELHALDMAVRAVHAEHRMRGRLPTPDRICELWAEAERRAYAQVGLLAKETG